jgi:hypothetical protein
LLRKKVAEKTNEKFCRNIFALIFALLSTENAGKKGKKGV